MKKSMITTFSVLILLALALIVAAGAPVPEDMSNTVNHFCNDTDDADYYDKGSVEDADGLWEDHCSANFLIEYTCEENYHDKIGVPCENGCEDGACIANETEEDEEDEEDEQEDDDGGNLVTGDALFGIEDEEEPEESEPNETSNETVPEEPEQTIMTDIELVDDAPAVIFNSLKKHSLEISEFDPYEMTEKELKDLTESLASIFNEEPATVFSNAKELKEKGSLYSEVTRLKKEHPLKAKTKFIFFRRSDPNMYQDILDLALVSTVFLESKIEIIQQGIIFGQALEIDSSRPALNSIDSEWMLSFPTDYNITGQTVGYNLSYEDDIGDKVLVGRIDVENDDKGQVTAVKMVSQEQRALIKTEKSRLVNLKTQVEIELESFDADSGIFMTTYSVPEKKTLDIFESLAKQNKINIKERAGVLDVITYNLDDKDIKSAKIIFKIEGNILGRTKPEEVYIFRLDKNKTEMLPTQHKGSDDKGHMIFEAESDGLSTFALFLTDRAASDKYGFNWWILLKVAGIIFLVIVALIVGLIIAGVYKRKH